MGFRQRERRRKRRFAQRRDQAAARASGSPAHWLTIASSKCCCNECGQIIKPGSEMVYRHTPREILCVPHADARKIYYRPSLKWEQQHRGKAA